MVKGAGTSPPPAWVESAAATKWLAFSSYCWTGAGKAACVDMIPPQSRTDLPLLKVRAGEQLRIHFAFVPRSVHLAVYRGVSFRHWILPRARTVSWKARGSGVVVIDAKAKGGTASYLIRLRTS